MRRYLSIILCIIFVLGIKAQIVTPYFPCTNRLEEPYGFCAHLTRDNERFDYATMNRQLQLMSEIGATNVRCDLDDALLNTTNSPILINVLNTVKQHNFNILGILYDSEFANKVWKSNDGFIRRFDVLQKRYINRFRTIEFCNEINLHSQESLAYHYLEDLKMVYSMKQHDPNVRILFSGLANIQDESFLDEVMKNGAYRYFDIMNYHTYSSPEQIPTDLKKVKDCMSRYNWAKPLWLTECGMPTELDSTNNTNKDFFCKVVPTALKKLGIKMKGMKYGIVNDSKRQYSTLNDDEIQAYVRDFGANPFFVTLDGIGNLNPKRVPVLVLTKDESFFSSAMEGVLNYMKRGGTIILPYGSPLYYDKSQGGKDVGTLYANQLHIGMMFWWTQAGKKLGVPEAPSYHRSNLVFGTDYSYSFNKAKGQTARFLTDDKLQGKDKMTAISFAGNNDYQGIVAALYQLNSNLKGNIIVQTRLRTQRYVNKEMEQARRVARIYLISFAYGVDKVFWYKFRSYEKDPYYTEDNFGVVHKDLSPKPAFYAYKALTTLCPSGSSRPRLEISGDLYKASWARPDGKTVWAVWNPKGDCGLRQLSYTGSPVFYDYMGKKLKNNNKGKYEINSGVLYAVGCKNLVVH